jgi:hypothetical protein
MFIQSLTTICPLPQKLPVVTVSHNDVKITEVVISRMKLATPRMCAGEGEKCSYSGDWDGDMGS